MRPTRRSVKSSAERWWNRPRAWTWLWDHWGFLENLTSSQQQKVTQYMKNYYFSGKHIERELTMALNKPQGFRDNSDLESMLVHGFSMVQYALSTWIWQYNDEATVRIVNWYRLFILQFHSEHRDRKWKSCWHLPFTLGVGFCNQGQAGKSMNIQDILTRRSQNVEGPEVISSSLPTEILLKRKITLGRQSFLVSIWD